MKFQIEEFRFCKTHVPKVAGKDQYGNFYPICYGGKLEEMAGKKSTCEIIIQNLKKEVK